MPCIGNVPIIVASGNLVSEETLGSPIPETTIYTPVSTGIFRISIYISVTPVVPACDLTLTWTDSVTDQSTTISPTGFSEGVTVADFTVQSVASDIQVSTSGGNTTGTYTLYYVVEQLA